MKSFGQKAFLSIFSFIVSCILVELFLRTTGYQPPSLFWSDEIPNIYTMDKNLIYRVRQNLNRADILTDENGIRIYDKKSNNKDYKIMLIGDSVVWGLAEKPFHYPKMLENKLNNKGLNTQVINAGVLGYSTDQELALFMKLYPIYQPDIVIWHVNINDIKDNYYLPLYTFNQTGLRKIPFWRNGVYFQGKLVSLLPHEIIRDSLLLRGLLASVGQLIPNTGDSIEKWSLQKMSLIFKEVARITRDNNIKLFFVIVPKKSIYECSIYTAQDYKSYLQIKEIVQDYTFIDLNSDHFLTQVKQDLDNNNAENVLGINIEKQFFLDESFQGNYPFSHPSPWGNQLMAEYIANFLINSVNFKN